MLSNANIEQKSTTGNVIPAIPTDVRDNHPVCLNDTDFNLDQLPSLRQMGFTAPVYNPSMLLTSLLIQD